MDKEKIIDAVVEALEIRKEMSLLHQQLLCAAEAYGQLEARLIRLEIVIREAQAGG